MGSAVRQVAELLFGLQPFHFGLWLLVTGGMLVTGIGLALLARNMIDPIAVEIALRPGRVLIWIPLGSILLPLVLAAFVVTVVGAAVSTIIIALLPALTIMGYIAVCFVMGDRLGRAFDMPLVAWAATAVGVIVIRAIRLIPYIGGPIHGMFVYFGFAAVCAVAFDISLSWYRRRMPDHEQFEGEQLIEWPPRAEETPAHAQEPRLPPWHQP